MTNPNQRSRKQKTTAKKYPAVQRPQANTRKGYYDANGRFHPVASVNPSPTSRPEANRPRSKAKTARRRSFKLAKAVLLILLCLAVGLVWHNMASNGSKKIVVVSPHVS